MDRRQPALLSIALSLPSLVGAAVQRKDHDYRSDSSVGSFILNYDLPSPEIDKHQLTDWMAGHLSSVAPSPGPDVVGLYLWILCSKSSPRR